MNKKIVFAASGIFIGIFVLNILTPWVADDFSYMHNFKTGLRINSFRELIDSVSYIYLSWSGRIILSFLAQLFMMWDKLYFNASNSIIYLALIYLIAKHIVGSQKLVPSLFIAVGSIVFLFAPVFGQTMLWNTGSFIYMWGAVFVLAFLLPYRVMLNGYNKQSKACSVIMFFSGAFAGLTMENISVSAAVVCFTFVLVNKHRLGKSEVKMPIWSYSGFVGICIGFIVLIIAPGNFVRNSVAGGGNLSSFSNIFSNFCYAVIVSAVFLIVPCILFLVLFIWKAYVRKKHNKYEKANKRYLIYALGTVISIASMSLSPGFPPRAVFAPFIFLIIAIGIFIFDNFTFNNIKLIKITSLCVVAITTVVWISAVNDISKLNDCWKGRVDYINSLESPFESDVFFEILVPKTKYSPIYALTDLRENSGEWPNPDIAKFYGVKSIRGINIGSSPTLLDRMYEYKDIIVRILRKE